MGMFDFKYEKMTDDQIMKVAMQVGVPPLRVAITVNGYRQSESFWCSVVELLCTRLNSKSGVVVRNIHIQSRNGKGVVGIRSIYEALRKVKPFAGLNGVMHDLKNNILPSLQDAGIICLIGDKIYVHPYMVGMHAIEVEEWCDSWRSVERKSHSKLQASSDMIHGYDADEVEKAIQFYRKAKALLNGE